MTVRKTCVLAMGLPAGATTWQMAGVDSAWTTTDHLLAQAVDVLNSANWQRANGKEADRPQPVPRPADQREAQSRHDRIRAKALAWRDRHEGGDDG